MTKEEFEVSRAISTRVLQREDNNEEVNQEVIWRLSVIYKILMEVSVYCPDLYFT